MCETNYALISAFYSALERDICQALPCHTKSLRLDFKTIQSRFDSEGFNLIAHRLPKFGKAIERALIQMTKLDEQSYQGFALHSKSRLPRFLYSLLSNLFDDSGQPKSREEIADKAIYYRSLRQILCAFAKARDLPTTYDELSVITQFEERVGGIPNITLAGMWARKARALLTEVFMPEGQLHPSLAQWMSNPWGKPGPGAVFGGETGRAKWLFLDVPGVSQDAFEHLTEFSPSEGEFSRTSRLELVPKDYRGPRLICVEPKELQFLQQGLLHVLESIVESHPRTRNSINFRNQELSRRLCRNMSYSTIDLKDASDLVSMQLCRILWPREVLRVLTLPRSCFTLTPNSNVRLRCFATMGSALCFPVETLTFWALAQGAIPEFANLKVRVFGDDIIVPNHYCDRIMTILETSGLKVNREKTCTRKTLIRESCGAYYFNREDVRIVQLKVTNCDGPLSWCALLDTAHELVARGYIQCAHAILESIHTYFPAPWGFFGFPERISEGTEPDSVVRWNYDYQRKEVRMPTVCATDRRSRLPDDLGIYAYFVGAESHPLLHGTVDKVKYSWIGV